MTDVDSESARALLRTPTGSVLLMRVSRDAETRGIWIAPGGRLEAGESPQAALKRELREEVGIDVARIGPELWTWVNRIDIGRGMFTELERMFLVETGRFEPRATAIDDAERRRFREFRWWQADEIARSSEVFVPDRLGELLRELDREGLPPSSRCVEGLRPT